MHFSIKERFDPSLGLCTRCEHGQIMEHRGGRVSVLCHNAQPPLPIRAPVLRCNNFEEEGTMSKFEMERIAWTIKPHKGKGFIGFETPAERRSQGRIDIEDFPND